MNFLFQNFFHKCNINASSNSSMTKIILISQKIFVLRLSKMAENQTEYSRLVIKFLLTKKCKLGETNRRMGNMYRKACFF